MNKIKILFLCAYDYSNVFKELHDLEFQVIIPSAEKMLSADGRNSLLDVLQEKALLLKYDQVAAKIDEINPDVLISFGWRRIITDEMLSNRLLNINVHPAILPQYKGYHPVPHVLLNNEQEHGITAHTITSDLDAGDIIHQAKFEINKFSTLRSLQAQVNDMMPSFMHNLLSILSSESSLKFYDNDTEKTKILAGRRTPEDSQLDGTESLNDAFDKIRACDSERFPAYFMVEGQKVHIKLSRAEVIDKSHELDI